jgi:tetratricopeptide (TPR) repeat protein
MNQAGQSRIRSYVEVEPAVARGATVATSAFRPEKRARLHSADDIALLNESGFPSLQNDRDDDSHDLSSQANGRTDGKSNLQHKKACGEAKESQTAVCATEAVDSSSDGVNVEGDEGTTRTGKATLMYIYQRQEYDEGMYLYDDALSADEIQSESIRSATLLYNVGQTHVHQRKYYEARRWFELALVRVMLNAQNSEAARVLVKLYHNLGHCHYRLGSNEESMRNYQKALAQIRDAGMGELEIAATNNCIAVLLFHNDASDSDKALKTFQETLNLYRKVYGPSSREVATILNNIGRVFYLKGDYSQALRVYKEALAIRRWVLGTESIDLAATMCNTGQTHHQLGDLEEAMVYYQEFLSLAETRLGCNHRDVAVIYKCMAEIYHERGDIEDARLMYEKALQAGRAALGNYHPDLASTINKLGNLYYELQDLDTALKYYIEGLKVEQVVLEPCHPHIMVTLMNIAQIHRHRGNFSAALITYGEVHALQLKAYGPNSLAVANTLSSMGLMQYQLKAYSSAFDLYQGALRIQRDHFGNDENADVASTLNSIGLVLFNQGVYGLAKSCFTDSLRIRQKIFGPDHRDVAILWYNIATIYLETGEDDFAIRLYKETLRVERKALGHKHHDVILTLQHLGLVHQQRGELDEALQYFSEALEIERTKEGTSQIAVGKLLNLIGNIHLQSANVEEMMTCYTEASHIYREWAQQNETLVIAGYNFYGISKLHPPSAPMA